MVLADGVVDIAIPDSSPVAGEMKEAKQSMLDGEFDVFDQGTITDQDGNVVIEDGVVQMELLDPFGNDFDDDERSTSSPRQETIFTMAFSQT